MKLGPSVRIVTPERPMSMRDAGFRYLERPRCPIHIGCVVILEGWTSWTSWLCASSRGWRAAPARRATWGDRASRRSTRSVPIVDEISLSLAVFSYDGWLHVGLDANADLVPDLGKLLHGIEDAFSRLVASAV